VNATISVTQALKSMFDSRFSGETKKGLEALASSPWEDHTFAWAVHQPMR
jgi:hypothetical protein